MFFEAHLILNVKTTIRLQKPHFVNFWWKHIKNESFKWYLDNNEQKAGFLFVSRTCALVLGTRFFTYPIGRAVKLPTWKVVHLERNLSTLDNSSSSSTFPSALKYVDVKSIFRKDDETDQENYRPISVLPTLSKVCERLMYKQMYPNLNNPVDTRRRNDVVIKTLKQRRFSVAKTTLWLRPKNTFIF